MMAAEPWTTNWEVADEIGQGGQGTTYLARNRADASSGVLKLLKKPNDGQSRRRMRLEVDALQLLSSKGASVPTVLETNVGRADELSTPLYFVMEFIDGETLDDFVKSRGKLNLEESLDFIRQIASTLAIGHSEGWGHRDIKPRNVMVCLDVDDSKRVVVLDYGITFNVDLEGTTRTSEHFWNEFYSLPETNVDGGHNRDLRTDVALVCAVFFFCLTGQYPQLPRDHDDLPPHKRPGKTLAEHLTDQAILPLIDSILFKGFSADINKRFQSVGELIDEMDRASRFQQDPRAEDPRVVAARETEIIRLNDRQTQLLELRPAVLAAHESFTKSLSRLGNRLGNFHIGVQSVIPNAFDFPKGIDVTDVPGVKFQVTIQPHGIRRSIRYCLVICDSNIQLFRYSTEPIEKRYLNGEMLYSFPASEKPDWATVEEDHNKWLNQSLVELRELVVATNVSPQTVRQS